MTEGNSEVAKLMRDLTMSLKLANKEGMYIRRN